MLPSRATTPARIFVPPRPTPCAWLACTAGTVTLRMAASGEKPYRVYRGGRTKGKVPLSRRDERGGSDRKSGPWRRGGNGGSGRPVVRRPKRSWTWKRWLILTVVALLVLLVVWTVG